MYITMYVELMCLLLYNVSCCLWSAYLRFFFNLFVMREVRKLTICIGMNGSPCATPLFF